MTELPHLLIVRLAPEILIKARQTRKRFQAMVERNLAVALDSAGVSHALGGAHGRLLLRVDDAERALDVLPRVFGLASFSPVDRVVRGDLDAVVAAAVELYADTVRGRTFAVRAKRLGRKVFSTLEMERTVGAALAPFGKVDLTRPEVTVRLDADDGTVYLHVPRPRGAGGLPLGSQGKAVVLVSGGFDSAVAAWAVMRRGVAVDFVFCNLGGAAYERQTLHVVKELVDGWGFGMRPYFFSVDFGPAMTAIRAEVDQKSWQLVLKRLMYRAGCRIAATVHGEALVTGEALGQVSSQTLSNLNSLEPAADLPVLRPLIATDKVDIIALARRIGTAYLSEHVKEYCDMTPRRPATRSHRGALAREEARIDPAVLDAALAGRRVIDLAALSDDDLALPYLFVDALPADAVVIDCRPAPDYDAWHVPGAIHRPADLLGGEFTRLDKDRPYVLYCTYGTRSAFLAEMMQDGGYEAYSFRGGVAALRRRVGT